MLLALSLSLLLACSDKDSGDGDGASDGGTPSVGVDADEDGFDSIESGGDDCDDADAAINPFADEYCNGIDDDCDGVVDEDSAADATRWYPDGDEDGFGDDERSDRACTPPDDGQVWIAEGGDCNDDDDEIFPGADEHCNGVDEDCDDDIDEDAVDAVSWYRDVDEDGYGGDTVEVACSAPDDGALWQLEGGDCDDVDDEIHPDAVEVCDDQDNDCNGLVDSEDPDVDLSTASTFFADGDKDGFGDATTSIEACSRPDGYVDNDTDCDDARGDVNPGRTEVCDDDDTDEDCNDLADDDDPGVDTGGMTTWVPDSDRDGYGSASASTVLSCNVPAGSTWVADDATDCDDGDASVHPGATEVCDALDTDEDCNDLADDDDPGTDTSTMSTWYLDADSDGYGSATGGTSSCSDPSTPATAYATNADDCDDDRSDVNPGQAEVCDDADTDEDCNDLADDDDPGTSVTTMTTWYRDADGDDYGDDDTSLTQCEDPAGAGTDWLRTAGDCDDSSALVNPAAEEICDEYDNDCDPRTSSDGLVSFVADRGTTTDLTATFGSGSTGSPTAISLDEAGALYLCGGTFSVNLSITADVSLQGYDGVVLSGGGSGHVVYVTGTGVDATLADLTIQDGVADRPSYYGASYPAGGGLMCDGASVSLSSVVIQDNDASYGGGAFLWDCDSSFDTVTIQGHDIDNWGAALWQEGGTLSMQDCLVQDNYGRRNGGLLTNRGDTTLIDTWIIDNAGGYYGGGLSVQDQTVTCTATASDSGGFLRNDGGSAAIDLFPSSGGARFISDGCSFGTGLDDNSPFDLELGYTEGFDYGDDASFTCTSTDSSDTCS